MGKTMHSTQLAKHRQPPTRSRSLLSRSRVNRAVEAARRVGGGLIVAAPSSCKSKLDFEENTSRNNKSLRVRGYNPLARLPARLLYGSSTGAVLSVGSSLDDVIAARPSP